MRESCRAALALAFSTASWELATAQTNNPTSEVVSESGLYRAIFHVPAGLIRVNLPDDVAAGDTISGTIYTEAVGKDQQERDRNSGELSGFVVDLDNQKAPAGTRQFQWRIDSRRRSGLIVLILRDRKNKQVAECKVPVDPLPSPAGTGKFDLPLGGESGSMVSAWGPFGGDFETSIAMNGQPATLIAASPRRVVFQTATGLSGRSTLEVKRGATSAQAPFHCLRLDLKATRVNLLRGETASMEALISGLEDLKQPASLVIVNRSPQTIAIAGGPLQRVTITPPEVPAGGTYQLTRTLTGVQGGGFNISVTVSRGISSQIPLQNLASRSVDRWAQANGVTVAPDAVSLIASNVAAAAPQVDELFRAQLPFHADPASLLDSLIRDYCYSLRDRKLQAGPVAMTKPARRSGIVRSFAQQAGAANVTIGASDVREFSFAQFLGQLLTRLTPSLAVGELVVNSEPPKQPITVDGRGGVGVVTVRSFFVSVGNHTVATMSCKEVIRVEANLRSTMDCRR